MTEYVYGIAASKNGPLNLRVPVSEGGWPKSILESVDTAIMHEMGVVRCEIEFDEHDTENWGAPLKVWRAARLVVAQYGYIAEQARESATPAGES